MTVLFPVLHYGMDERPYNRLEFFASVRQSVSSSSVSAEGPFPQRTMFLSLSWVLHLLSLSVLFTFLEQLESNIVL